MLSLSDALADSCTLHFHSFNITIKQPAGNHRGREDVYLHNRDSSYGLSPVTWLSWLVDIILNRQVNKRTFADSLSFSHQGSCFLNILQTWSMIMPEFEGLLPWKHMLIITQEAGIRKVMQGWIQAAKVLGSRRGEVCGVLPYATCFPEFTLTSCKHCVMIT